MDQELMRKAPATIVASRRVQASQVETLVAPHMRRWALMEEARRMERAGEIHVLTTPRWYPEREQWEMKVRRLREPVPAWRRPMLIAAGVGGALGTLFGLGWWALATLAATPGLAFLAVGGAVFVIWVCVRHRNVRVRVTTTVDVRVR